MANNELEIEIRQAVIEASQQIVAVIKNSTLQDLIALQAQGKSLAGRSAKRTVSSSNAVPDETIAAEPEANNKKGKIPYPKCAYPGCDRNLFMRGKGFCGVHWKMWRSGQIEDSAHYLQQEDHPG